jgi:hypothetical protein
METVDSKAANAIRTMKLRRYSLSAIVRWVEWECGVDTSVSSLSRIMSGERNASEALEKALIKAAKVMK